MQKPKINRWLILIASVLANLCIGSAYAWSVFQKPLIEMFGWTTAQASLAFTLNFSTVPFAMMIAGKIQDQQGPRKVTLVGGLIFGVGIISAGFTNSLTMLYMTYGVLGGLGMGTVYACTVANTVKWFPDKRGLAGGLAAAGFGSGAVVFAPLAVSLIGGYGVLTTFKILGAVFAIAIVLCALMISAPSSGWKPLGWEPKISNEKATVGNANIDKTAAEMIRTPNFYILWAMYTIGCISGLMIIGHASPIAQEKIGLSPQIAALAVSILSMANAFGRIFWGTVSDKLGRYTSIILMYIVSSGMLMLLASAKSFGIFIIATCGIALSFGGFLGIFPSVTADSFGAKNLGINYGIMFTAFGLAAFFGPRIAAVVKQSSGGEYGKAFLISATLNIIGIIFTLIINKQLKKQKEIESTSR